MIHRTNCTFVFINEPLFENLSRHFLFQTNEKTFVTIGTFDGVHFGHQEIINKLVDDAKLAGKKSVLLTFFPHPRMVLQKGTTIALINTIEERTAAVRKNRIGLPNHSSV